jgi:hypothetical protein
MKSNKINDKSKLQKLTPPKVEEGESNGRLTLDELRKCEGFADVSDADGEEIIESLYRLSLIVFNYKATQ